MLNGYRACLDPPIRICVSCRIDLNGDITYLYPSQGLHPTSGKVQNILEFLDVWECRSSISETLYTCCVKGGHIIFMYELFIVSLVALLRCIRY